MLVANHSTLIEPQVIFGVLPRRSVFLVKSELVAGAARVWLLRRIGQLPVRRGEPDRAALMAAVGGAAGGGLLGVFPEGTRGSGDVSHAEQGAAWLVRVDRRGGAAGGDARHAAAARKRAAVPA